MLEATLAGEDHGCVGFVTGLNALEIPGRAARLNHGCNTLTQADIHTVPEREKGVGNHTQPFAPYTQVRHQLPDNFDEFWPSRKNELAGISMNPKLIPVDIPESMKDKIECFDVQINCAGVTADARLLEPDDNAAHITWPLPPSSDSPTL